MFFDNLVQMENNEQCLLSAWSNSEVNVMLAVATNVPRIVFMSDEGTLVPNFEITRGKNQITQMKWHPVLHALAIGWSDGCITLWQEDDRLIRDEKVSSVFSWRFGSFFKRTAKFLKIFKSDNHICKNKLINLKRRALLISQIILIQILDFISSRNNTRLQLQRK